VLVGAAAVFSMLSITAAPANAYSTQEVGWITRFLERGGGNTQPLYNPTPPAPIPGHPNIVDDLWLSEHRPMPNQATSRALHQELLQLRSKAGFLAKLRGTGGMLVSRFPLVAGAAYGGWKIGGGLRSVFFGPGIAMQPCSGCDAVIGSAFFVEKGESLVSGAFSILAPEDGFIGQTANGGSTLRLVTIHTDGTLDTNPQCQVVNTPDAPDFGGGWTTLRDGPKGFATNCGTDQKMASVPFKPLFATGANDTMALTEPYASQLRNPTDFTNFSPMAWSFPEAEGIVKQELDNNPSKYPVLRQVIDHNLYGTPDPIPSIATMPNCVGLSYNACITALQNAGFGVFVRQTRSFQAAVPIPQAAAAQVFGTTPASGSRIATDTSIAIDSNPDQAAMPVLVPAPLTAAQSQSGQGETPAQYATRIAAAPYNLPSSAATVLPDDFANPEFGPDAVVTSDPAPGSRVPQNTPVTPRTNPPGVPTVGGSGASCDPWVSPSINFGPLQGLGVTNKFPFAVPFWVFDALNAWVGSPVTPAWDFHFPFAGAGNNWHVTLEMFDPSMPAIRSVLLAASLIAMAWFFLSLAMGTPSGRQQGGSE
jgi:hypothetical protein